MTHDLLDIDVRLLIIRYGKRKVLEALARLGEQTLDELMQQLPAVKQGSKSKTKRRAEPPSLIDLVASETRGKDDLTELVRVLAVEFQNRTFLPHLRDVQRFLDRAGVPHGHLKSRAAAARVVIRALATLSRDELLHLAERDRSSGDSDYSLLARAIMGTSHTHREQVDPDKKTNKG